MYFLTKYRKVHDRRGLACIRLDGKDAVCFTWYNGNLKECDYSTENILRLRRSLGDIDIENYLKEKWDRDCTYSELDFLDAALCFRNMSIKDALKSDNYIIKIFAILDRRVGERTLEQIAADKLYKSYPEWVRQFYDLRLSL